MSENKIDEMWPQYLMEWYRKERRDLPWRHTHDPYRVWISEIMLQQTRVDTVIGYYERFLKHFPTVEALAEAPIEEVLKCWEGLGYYSRARNLHKAASQICEKGYFPEKQEEIRELSGIGDYTSGSIASIAFNYPAAAVDGNVLRVISRLYALWDDIMAQSSRKNITRIVVEHMPEDDPSKVGEDRYDYGPNAFTQSLMELGALVCTPASPRCEICPLGQVCQAYRDQLTSEIPVKKKKEVPKQEVHLLVTIERVNPDTGKIEYLMHQRPEEGLLKGLWEYPGMIWEEEVSDSVGMKSETGLDKTRKKEEEGISCDSMERSLQDALQKEYGIPIEVGPQWMTTQHVFSHRHWKMMVYRGTLSGKTDWAFELGNGWFWDDPSEETPIMIPTAFQAIRKKLKSETKKRIRK